MLFPAMPMVFAACVTLPRPASAPMASFTLFALPPTDVGTCYRGPFLGDFMEGDAAPGLQRVALDVGSIDARPWRTVRVILDSLGTLVSFRDDIIFRDSATTASVRFHADGSVASGMEHRHVSREATPTSGDRALGPERYAAVVQFAHRLLERCRA